MSAHVSSAAAYDGVPACMSDDTMTPRRVRLDVDMRIHAALADEAQVSKAFKQRGGNRCPFTNQDQRFSLSQSFESTSTSST